MPHLLQGRGETALAGALRRVPLLAFDFDGTLAPIATTPEKARVSRSVSGKLARLCRHLPVAVISGRSRADVSGRLDFQPHFVVGNHGCEMEEDALATHGPELDAARQLLASQAQALAAAGVSVEDKGLSIALHYRLARRPEQALATIRGVLQPLEGRYRTFGGKMVENVVLPDAPDKSRAVHHLVDVCGTDCAIFVGDDVNDEPVFASAPPHWLTIRVGREDASSRAAFFVDSTAEVALVLDRMLLHLGA
ncbi:trehalose-phosphatase [Ramlibacter algicola]|uniref:Trehalose 6-phosphate phosphatase n=1 Tax=Ramlibacter algicola TaxID=2795217 RepID=A0A934Q3B9_9BURK|nr:trehalose-phosphatase [Ramlibacter algicola]MBK0393771.1 trehalose-phosphatase [Ramlibacter algicola]